MSNSQSQLLDILEALRSSVPWSSTTRMRSLLQEHGAADVGLKGDGRIWANWFPNNAEDRWCRRDVVQGCEVLTADNGACTEAMFFLDFVETMEATHEDADEEAERRFAERVDSLNPLGSGLELFDEPRFERSFENAPMGGFRHAVVWIDADIRVGLAIWHEDSGLPITTTLHVRPGSLAERNF